MRGESGWRWATFVLLGAPAIAHAEVAAAPPVPADPVVSAPVTAVPVVPPSPAPRSTKHANEDGTATVAEVDSDTSAQFYDVRSPTGDTVLLERRVTTTLTASVSNILSDAKHGEVFFRTRLRYDGNFGRGSEEVNPRDPAHFVPGFARGPADFMYAYLEGRRLFGGLFGFRLGRQVRADSLGFYSFDGGLVKVATPVHVSAEVYGGFEARGGMPLYSSSRYEAGGMWRGSRDGMDPGMYPSFEQAYPAPTFGAELMTEGLSWLSVRAGYRHAWNTGSYNASPFVTTAGLGGTRTSTERFGASANVNLGEKAGIRTGLNYDFYSDKINTAFAGVDVYPTKALTFGFDFDHFDPSWDADTIWNFFQIEPSEEFALRASAVIQESWSVSAGAQLRVIHRGATEGLADGTTEASSALNHGATILLRHRKFKNMQGLSFVYNTGDAGDRSGADAFAEQLLWSRVTVEGRLGAWHFSDSLRPDRNGLNLGGNAGVGYRFTANTRALIDYQLDTNRLVGLRNKVMFWFTVGVLP